MNALMKFAAALAMLTGTACTTTTYTATEQAICDVWRDSLVTISHNDTEQTQDEAKNAFAVQRDSCRR